MKELRRSDVERQSTPADIGHHGFAGQLGAQQVMVVGRCGLALSLAAAGEITPSGKPGLSRLVKELRRSDVERLGQSPDDLITGGGLIVLNL